jgi:peroxiredoxin
MRNAALATLGLTAIHHAYGAIVYGTPWRMHGAVVAIAVGAVLLVFSIVYQRTRRKLPGYVLATLVLAIPVLGFGLFEGAYNHLLKNILYFAGAPHDTLVRWFPPPTYELPDDAVFEITGIAHVVPATFALLATIAFVRAVQRPRGCERPACNAVFPLRCLTSVTGEPVALPDRTRLVHLQLRRFAGCPVCNLHLSSFVRRHGELTAAGIRELVVFHAPGDELAAHAAGLPFGVIADPDKQLYRELGVGSSVRALLDPRVWGTILVAVTRSLVGVVRGRDRAPSLAPHGGRFGLPADFLIDPSGRIVACKHGVHADDQWSLDEVLELARARSRAL